MEELIPNKSVDFIGMTPKNKNITYFGRKKFDDYSYVNKGKGNGLSLQMDNEKNYKMYQDFMKSKEKEIENNMDHYRDYMKRSLGHSNNNSHLKTSLSAGNLIINTNFSYNNNNSYKSNNMYTAESLRKSTDITNPDYFTKKINGDYQRFKERQKNYLQYNQDIVNQKLPLDIIRKENNVYYNDKGNMLKEQYNINKQYFGRRKWNLGKSSLQYNPIVNPVGNYQYNKYLYKSFK